MYCKNYQISYYLYGRLERCISSHAMILVAFALWTKSYDMKWCDVQFVHKNILNNFLQNRKHFNIFFGMSDFSSDSQCGLEMWQVLGRSWFGYSEKKDALQSFRPDLKNILDESIHLVTTRFPSTFSLFGCLVVLSFGKVLEGLENR